jgi:putative Holliday junction resolvase
LRTLKNDEHIWEHLHQICQEETIGQLVVGLPRGLDGQETPQTLFCRQFAAECSSQLGLPVELQDEALTSHKAEIELTESKRPFPKEHIDALAAVYILEDYLREHPA